MSARMTTILVFACIILIGIVLMLLIGNGGGVKTFSGAHFVQEDNYEVSEHTFCIPGGNAGRAGRQGNTL